MQAETKYVSIAPRKARLVADLIRGKKAVEALDQLRFRTSKASRLLYKTVRSAIANAEMKDARKENLVIVEIKVDGGPHLKRWAPGNKGTRKPILKRTSHFTVVVA